MAPEHSGAFCVGELSYPTLHPRRRGLRFAHSHVLRICLFARSVAPPLRKKTSLALWFFCGISGEDDWARWSIRPLKAVPGENPMPSIGQPFFPQGKKYIKGWRVGIDKYLFPTPCVSGGEWIAAPSCGMARNDRRFAINSHVKSRSLSGFLVSISKNSYTKPLFNFIFSFSFCSAEVGAGRRLQRTACGQPSFRYEKKKKK